jgi:predicted transcriptional regulator
MARRRGQRHVRPAVLIEEYMAALGTGARLEIARVLAAGPMCVSDIAAALFLSVKSVSRDLATMEQLGLVTHSADKLKRVYRLCPRVLPRPSGDNVQITVLSDHCHWMTVHLSDGSAPKDAVQPPSGFINGKTMGHD